MANDYISSFTFFFALALVAVAIELQNDIARATHSSSAVSYTYRDECVRG
jgi:hypothetical protein